MLEKGRLGRHAFCRSTKTPIATTVTNTTTMACSLKACWTRFGQELTKLTMASIAPSLLVAQANQALRERQATMSGCAPGCDVHHAPALRLRPAHHRRLEVLDRGCAHLLHDGGKLDAQELEHPLHAGLAESAEAPDVGPADAHALRAHRERLRDIGAAAETAVDQDRHAAPPRPHDPRPTGR